MAVNEDLYNWILKTYGMQPAEWYRSNPRRPPASNPFLPKGSYVPSAKKEDPSVQQFLASASETEKQLYSQLNPEQLKYAAYRAAAEKNLNFGSPLAEGDYAATNGLTYYPTFGQYGSYLNAPRDNREGGKFIRAATESDPEVQRYGIYNVGLPEYQYSRRQQAIAKNIELLKQQSEQGNEDSRDFLDKYLQEKDLIAQEKRGPRGEEIEAAKGPRGETLASEESDVDSKYKDLIAAEYGKGFREKPQWEKDIDAQYEKYRKNPYQPGIPKPGRGMGDTWEGPVREAKEPTFDRYKALASVNAADKYKESLRTTDPFKSGAFS